jgi:hypothetical protein
MVTDIEVIICKRIGDWPRWAYLYAGDIDACIAKHQAAHGWAPKRVYAFGGLVLVETQGKAVEEEE